MLRQIIALILICTAPAALSPVSAQTPSTPASGDLLPDAVAGACIRVVATGEDIFVYNDCGYRVVVAACVPRNARLSFLCKPEGSEDIGAVTFNINARSNFGTGFPNGADIYQMTCRAPAKPVLITATQGKCLQP